MPNKANTGSKGRQLSTQEALNVQTAFPGYYPYEDILFQAGDSPVILDIKGDTGELCHGGYIANSRSVEGTPELGDLLVELEEVEAGVATWGPQFRLLVGDILSLDGHTVKRIRLTHSGTNCAYRVIADKLY